jgi:hypothetical protein
MAKNSRNMIRYIGCSLQLETIMCLTVLTTGDHQCNNVIEFTIVPQKLTIDIPDPNGTIF